MAHRTVWWTPREVEIERERFFGEMDQPTAEGLEVFLIIEAASRLGVKVVLAGVGGRELLGKLEDYQSFHRVLRGPDKEAVRTKMPRPLGALLDRVLKAGKGRNPEPGRRQGEAYLRWRGLYSPGELARFLDRDFIRAGVAELACSEALSESVGRVAVSRLQFSALEMTWPLRSQELRVMEWASMPRGVRVRMPYLDPLIVECFGSIAARSPDCWEGDIFGLLAPGIGSCSIPPGGTGRASPAPERFPGDLQARRRAAHEAYERTGHQNNGYYNMGPPPFSTGSRAPRFRGAGFSGGRGLPGRVGMRWSRPRRSILVFRPGQLGDTIVAAPAFSALRLRFPEARLVLVSGRHSNANYVLAADLLGRLGLIDSSVCYPVRKFNGGVDRSKRRSSPGAVGFYLGRELFRLRKSLDKLVLVVKLRATFARTLVYLAASVQRGTEEGRGLASRREPRRRRKDGTRSVSQRCCKDWFSASRSGLLFSAAARMPVLQTRFWRLLVAALTPAEN